MAEENTGILTEEQREFYEKETGKPLPDGVTWEGLEAEQRSVLESVYAPRSEDGQPEFEVFDGTFEEGTGEQGATTETVAEPVSEEQSATNKPKYSFEQAMKIVAARPDNSHDELYNMEPAQLTALNNVLRENVIEGKEGAYASYAIVRATLAAKLEYYGSGEIEIPIQWAGEMQEMIDAARTRLPEKEKYVEEPVTGMHDVTAQNWSQNIETLAKLSIKDLAQLKVEMDKDPEGFNKENVDKAIFNTLETISKMGRDEFLNKEDFASVQVLKDSIPMSQRMESAGHVFDVFTRVESKLYSSRQEINRPYDDINSPIYGLADVADRRLRDFTKEYDNIHGLTDITSEDAAVITANMEAMDSMGKDALDKQEYKEVPVKPMSMDEAEAALRELKSGKPMGLQTLASLAASNAFGTVGPDEEYVAKTVAAMVSKIQKNKDALKPEDLASYEVLLGKAAMMPETMMPQKTFKKAKEKLNKDREEAKKNPKPKYKEMDDAITLLDNLQITDGFTLTGKRRSKEEADLKAQFIEAVRLQTQQQMATTKPGPVTPEDFNKAFAATMVGEIARLAGVESVISESKRPIEDLVKDKKIQISKDALLGYQAAQSNDREGFASRLESKVGKCAGVDKMKTNNKALDDKLVKANPKSYQTLKSIGKSAVWMGAYGVAGAFAGPAGVAVVATASFAKQTWQLRKQYKAQKAEMAKKGKKLKLWSFLKSNKMALASAALTAAGGLTAGLSVAAEAGMQIGPDVIANLQIAKYHSGIALGAASTVKTFKEVRKNGGSIFKAMSASAISGIGTGWAVISGQSHHQVETSDSMAAHTTLSDVMPVQEAGHEPAALGGMGFSAVTHDADGNTWINDKLMPSMSDQQAEVTQTPSQAETVVQPEAVAQTEVEPAQAEPKVVHTPELDAEFSKPLEAPMASVEVPETVIDEDQLLDNMQAQLDENRVYAVQDPNSGKLVEFSLSDNGEVMTRNAEEIGLVGSKELHAAMADRVAQEVGGLSDRELAYLSKNMSNDQFMDVQLADLNIKAQYDADIYVAEAKAALDGLEDGTANNGVAPQTNEDLTTDIQQPAAQENQQTATINHEGQQHDGTVKERVEAAYQRDVAEMSKNGIPLEAADKLDNEQIITSDDGKGTATFVGKDENGDAFKIINHDGPKGNFTEVEVGKDHPMYDKLNSSDEAEAAFAKMDFLQKVSDSEYKTAVQDYASGKVDENITTSNTEQASVQQQAETTSRQPTLAELSGRPGSGHSGVVSSAEAEASLLGLKESGNSEATNEMTAQEKIVAARHGQSASEYANSKQTEMQPRTVQHEVKSNFQQYNPNDVRRA